MAHERSGLQTGHGSFARALAGLVVASSLSACSGDDASSEPKPEPHPAPVPNECVQDLTPGPVQKVDCDGLTFDLWVPDVCVESACGLIVDTHGFGMNGELQNVHTQLASLGNDAGYIVIQPNAPGNVPATSWSANGGNDAQVLTFMQRVMDAWHVDPKRVHFTGFSQGGYMTWRFVCKHADIIASAAPLAAGTGTGGGGSCPFSGSDMPSRETPIFYVHGTTDGLVNFATALPQRDAVIAAWNLDLDEVVSSGADHEWTRYKNAGGTVFEFAQHDWRCDFTYPAPLEGHCVPGSDAPLGCGANNAFNWGQTVLAFFQAHPME